MPVNVSNRKYVLQKCQIEHNTFQGQKQFKSALSTYTQDLIQCLILDSSISMRAEIKLYKNIILAQGLSTFSKLATLDAQNNRSWTLSCNKEKSATNVQIID